MFCTPGVRTSRTHRPKGNMNFFTSMASWMGRLATRVCCSKQLVYVAVVFTAIFFYLALPKNLGKVICHATIKCRDKLINPESCGTRIELECVVTMTQNASEATIEECKKQDDNFDCCSTSELCAGCIQSNLV